MINPSLQEQISPSDEIVFVLPVEFVRPGCIGVKRVGGGYVAITNERLIFEATIITDTTIMGKSKDYKVMTTNIPISNVSSVSIVSYVSKGCLKRNIDYALRINVHGGFYDVYVGRTAVGVQEFIRSFLASSQPSQ